MKIPPAFKKEMNATVKSLLAEARESYQDRNRHNENIVKEIVTYIVDELKTVIQRSNAIFNEEYFSLKFSIAPVDSYVAEQNGRDGWAFRSFYYYIDAHEPEIMHFVYKWLFEFGLSIEWDIDDLYDDNQDAYNVDVVTIHISTNVFK